MYFKNLILCLLIPLFIFCKTNEKDSNISKSDGWHYIKNENGEDERFFAIGAWSVPGYSSDRSGRTDRTYEQEFKTQARNINIILTHQLQLKDYMAENNRIVMYTAGSDFLRAQLNKIPHVSNKGLENGYYRSQYLKKAIKDSSFVQALDENIKRSKDVTFSNIEIAYLPIDEVAQGMIGSHWFIPPAVGDKIYERISLFNEDAIVFVDLAGHGKGSTFFFEKRYLTEHDSMPLDPPYDAIKIETARNYALDRKESGNGSPLIAFYEGYDGVPTYNFDNNKASYTPYTQEELRKVHYENIKTYAQAYKKNGNVFGINAFNDFRDDPNLAGVTVDAIRAGLDDPKTPIWLYFDGNGYSKPPSMSASDYVNELVKCQIYTSIIHGATGIFFWNDSSKTPEVWNEMQSVLEELNSNLHIVKLDTEKTKIDNDLHVLIKKDEEGKKYIIASNTSKTKTLPLDIENIEKRSIAPLEVLVSRIN